MKKHKKLPRRCHSHIFFIPLRGKMSIKEFAPDPERLKSPTLGQDPGNLTTLEE
jgi:hypothetical protein